MWDTFCDHNEADLIINSKWKINLNDHHCCKCVVKTISLIVNSELFRIIWYKYTMPMAKLMYPEQFGNFLMK